MTRRLVDDRPVVTVSFEEGLGQRQDVLWPLGQRRDLDDLLARLAQRFREASAIDPQRGRLRRQDDPGVWTEKCSGCGDCMLAFTGGICPVARCAKRLFNGPCGGSSKGKCEITPLVGRDVECAWHTIIERFKELGTIDNYHELRMPKDWQPATDSVPRILKHVEQTPYRNMEMTEDDSII